MASLELFPQQASAMADKVDTLFFVLLGTGGTMLLILAGLILGFSIRYRKGATVARAAHLQRQETLEFTWTSLTLLIFLGLFVPAAWLYVEEAEPPSNAIEIHAIGKQWMWKFQHPDGQREINTLHVPLGRPVKMIMSTQDVIHSFYVPAFRVKQDVVPGRYTMTWFTATRTGRYHLFCAEFCGTDHARMKGEVVVMKPAEYQDWLSRNGAELSLAAEGARLFSAHGCIGCHGAGSVVHCPPLGGVFGKAVPLQGGETVIADETYIRDSILLPRKQVVAGYAPIMPSFAGQLSEADLVKLIAYIKSLSLDERSP